MGSLVSVPEDISLDGKIAIVTGANTGVGFATTKDLARRKGHVILACRRPEEGKKAVERVKTELKTSNPSLTDEDIKVEYMPLDLGSLKSVREFASSFLAKDIPLHYLINNAGIMNTPYGLTEDGFESQFGVNHLGHFLLTNLLLDKLKSSAPSKIINLSSMAHAYGTIKFDDLKSEKSYSSWGAYSQSKIANVLFTFELARRLEGTGVTCNAVHPGFVATDLARHSGRFIGAMQIFGRTPEKGAMTTLYAALHPDVNKVTGEYFADTAVTPAVAYSHDKEVQKKLWEVSEELVGLKN